MTLLKEIQEVGAEKGIDREILVETLETAILTAARRTFGVNREFDANFNETTGEVELDLIMHVVDEIDIEDREILIEDVLTAGEPWELGEEVVFRIFYRPEDAAKAQKQDEKYGELLKLNSYDAAFGRVAAQTAKQVIIQRIREAERDIVYNEFKDRVGEMVNGQVRRFEKGDVIVELGRASDAILPRREQTPRESYRPGERIQAMIKEVRRSSRDPQVVLTRADPQILFRLFEQEVPEIYEGIVRIVAVAREPGVRSKVAVYSRESDVDPVGACVGMRGARVQAVVQELRGEKIDIVQYVENPAPFVCNAILPAEVSKVLIDEAAMTMELIVPDDQLSLAIGRGGQNVRLAAQLTGWNLDIISETRLRNIMTEARNNLLEFEGLTEENIDTLFSLGYNKLEHIAGATVAELAQIPGYTTEAAEKIIKASGEILARPTQKSVDDMTPDELERRTLQTVRGVGGKVANAIHAAGFTTIEHIAFAEDSAKMAETAGIPEKKGRQLVHAAKEQLQRDNQWSDDELETARLTFLGIAPEPVVETEEDVVAADAVVTEDEYVEDEPFVPPVILQEGTPEAAAKLKSDAPADFHVPGDEPVNAEPASVSETAPVDASAAEAEAPVAEKVADSEEPAADPEKSE